MTSSAAGSGGGLECVTQAAGEKYLEKVDKVGLHDNVGENLNTLLQLYRNVCKHILA